MDMELIIFLMEISIRDNIDMVNLGVEESILGLLELLMKENSKRDINMVEEDGKRDKFKRMRIMVKKL